LTQQLLSVAADNMDLTNKTVIKDLLKKYGGTAEKKFGQHFILSKKALAKMIAAAEIKKGDTIVEIGPGLGTLTQELAKSGVKITAIEKDPIMAAILNETLKDFKNVKIIKADARQLSILRINSGKKYKIVANLPYNIATFLIHQWLESKNPPKTMVLMIQKEVARRIVAKPPRMNLLAVSVQFYAGVKIIDYVKKGSFWPQPKVDSAIIEIIPNPPATPARTWRAGKNAAFFAVVKAGFSQPRKQLLGNLAKKLSLSKEQLISIFKNINISEKARAENLSLDQWRSLTFQLNPKLYFRRTLGAILDWPPPKAGQNRESECAEPQERGDMFRRK